MNPRTRSATIPPSKNTPRRRISALLAFALLIASPAAFAGDVDSAKQALEKAKVDVSNKSWESADKEIKETEEFLDGVPAADRAPVQKELDALKTTATAGLKDYKSKEILDTAKRDLDRVAEYVTTAPGTVGDTITATLERLNSADAKKYCDPEAVKKLVTRANGLQDMTMKKQSGQKLERAAAIVKELDDAMAADPFKSAKSNEDTDHAVQQISQLISRVRGAIDGVPATDPGAKAINDKLAGYEKRMQTAAGGAMAAQAAEQLAHQWKSQQEYFAGWDQEKAGPTWTEYSTTSSQGMSDLQMPKTVELLTRMQGWFESSAVKPVAEQFKDDATVKATLAEAHKAVTDASTKLHAAFGKVLDDAEKIATPKDESTRGKADTLADRANMWFKGTPFHDGDVARAKALSEKWNGGVARDAAALQAALTKLTNDATAAWPGIAGSMKADDGFTPDKLDDFKGKTIHLKANNRLGWDYQPGDYHFAMAINGMPIAGKFDPKVRAAVNETKKQTGQDLPDDGWDVYAVVEGSGKIDKRVQDEGKVKIDGTDVGTVTRERNETIPCAVVRIVALHAGPVAVGPNSAPIAASGGAASAAAVAGGATAAAAGSSGMKTVEHVAELLLCLGAAGLVVMATKPSLAGAAGVTSSLPANDNVAMAGLVVAGLGVLWLLAKLIVGDLLPALSLTASGVIVAADWLRAKNVLPASAVAKLKPLALPVAGATALFGILHLFLAHWVLF